MTISKWVIELFMFLYLLSAIYLIYGIIGAFIVERGYVELRDIIAKDSYRYATALTFIMLFGACVIALIPVVNILILILIIIYGLFMKHPKPIKENNA